jgi:hypothetical protein
MLTDLVPSTFRREMTAPDSPIPDDDAQGHETGTDIDRPGRVADLTLRDAMQVKISWVRSFLAVAERGGFGAATSKLHLSQSRVSAHVSALEELLGFELLERRVRPTALTEPGRIFAEHAKKALDALQDGIEAARAALRPGYGHLVVGTYPSVSSVFLPSVLAALGASHPAMSIEFLEGNASSLEASQTSRRLLSHSCGPTSASASSASWRSRRHRQTASPYARSTLLRLSGTSHSSGTTRAAGIRA